jgi:predicted phosphodiesterase
MNILILSDLHIDTNDQFGTFQWNELDFIMHLEKVRYYYNIDKVIFNGDTFELMKYRMEEIQKTYKVLIKYFKNKDFVFIKGNHDIVSRTGLESYDIMNSKGMTIHIEHGHNADWMNGTKAGRALGNLGFGLLKLFTSYKPVMNIYMRIVTHNEQIHYVPKKYNTIKYLLYALRLLKEYDVVILGHTHKLESHHTYYLNRKKRYLNCGSCSMGRFQGIVFNTETLEYEMLKESKENILVPDAIMEAV